MNAWNGFGQLDLSGIEEEQFSQSLRPGNYICKVIEAKVEPTANGLGQKLLLTFEDTAGGGKVRDFINISNQSQQAQEIGLKRLKSLLIKSRHPNPNRPSDVATLVGLTVGIRVIEGEPWRDQKGQMQRGGGEPKGRGAYFATDENVQIGPLPEPPAPTGSQTQVGGVQGQQGGQQGQGFKAPF